MGTGEGGEGPGERGENFLPPSAGRRKKEPIRGREGVMKKAT